MKQIGFVGSVDSTDIVLYLARLLSANEKKVAVVDYTKRHLFIRTADVPDVLFGSGAFYKDILVVSVDAAFNAEELNNYEYVFHYFGTATTHPQIKRCMEMVFVSDMVMSNAELLSEVEVSEGTVKHCIIRNAIDVKYKTMFLVDLMNQGFTKKEVVVVPYTEQDFRVRCHLCTDTKKKIKIKELSSGMQGTLLNLFARWETADDKTLKKIIKNA